MPVFGTQMFGSGGGAAAYSIENSLCFNDDDSPSLSFTPSSAGNQRTWTLSYWFKLCRNAESTSAGMNAFSAGGGNFEFLLSDSNSSLYLIDGGGLKRTSAQFRDMSGWTHIILAADTTQGTESNRMKIYHNGVHQTDYETNNSISENYDFNINTAAAQIFGHRNSGGYWDGYLAECIFVDGTQQAATDLGEFDDNGVWRPIDPSGLTFGTNGYWLKFADSSSLGTDSSGNGNNFTPSNLAATDQVTDSPTKNYAIMNYNDAHREGSCVLSEGNLKWTNSNTGNSNDVRATFGMSSGKWYWECELDTLGQSGVNREFVGVVGPSWEIDSGSGGTSFPQVSGNNGYAIATKGDKISGGTTTSYGSAMSAGDIVGVALDLDNGKIWFSINGTYPNSGDPAAGSNEAFSGLSGMFQPAFAADYGTGNSTLIANFGQRSLNTAAPSGFNELNTSNFSPAISDPSAHFQIALYSGNSSTQTITFDGNSDMQPDFIWVKSRSNSDAHVIQESGTGTGTAHFLSRTNSDAVTDAVTSFNSDGFALGDGSELSSGTVNTSGRTYVSLNWKGNGSGSSNTTGTINTTKTSANTTAGISINTYTGNGTDQATYGHGLGVTPIFSWTFSLSSADNRTSSVWVYGDTAFSEQVGLSNVDDAFSSSDGGLGKVEAGSSTVLTLGTDPAVNGSTITYMSLVFAEIEGFSRFSSYTGTGNSDGPFVYCGFSPEFVMTKADRGGEPWTMFDGKRSTFNLADDYLMPSNSDAESTSGSIEIDFLCNGFKVRGSDSRINRDGHDIIFAAFARHPFGGEDLSPAPGR